MAIFEYQYRKSPAHEWHPATKFVIMAVLSVLISFVQDPRVKIVLLVIAIACCVIAKLPFREYRTLLLFILISTLLASIYQVFFVYSPEQFQVLDKEWAGTTIVEILPEGFPILGRAALTYGGLVWWTNMPLTALCVVLTVAFYIYTTPLTDTLQLLYELHAPFPVVYVASVAMRFVPELVQKIFTVRTAQQLRGWSGKTRNPIKAFRLYAPLLVPIVRHIIKATDTMSMSATNRGFGLHRVHALRSMRLKTVDRAIIIGCALFFLVSMVAIFRYKVGML